MRQVFNAEPKGGKRYFLYFGAVNYQAHVYLNGKKLGTHKGGFTPFQFDVSGKLNQGRNVVVVKVDNMRHQDEIPTVNTDWWNYGGITRDVLLAEVPATYIADYKVQLAKGDLTRIQGFVQLAGAQPRQSVSVTIRGAGIRTTVQTDAGGRAAIDIDIDHAAAKLRYWSPEAPTLYDVEIAAGPDTVKGPGGFPHHRDARPGHPAQREVDLPARDLAARREPAGPGAPARRGRYAHDAAVGP